MVSCGDLSIHTLSTGSREGQHVLLLHGKAFQAQTWQDLETLQLLADNGCFALALDLPGWGRSPEAEFSPKQIVNDIITNCQLEKPIIVGPSMGGKIALEFCLEFPHLIGGLILIGAVGVHENLSNLAKLPEQTLIIWGENDHISDPANGELLHKEIVGSQLVIVPGTKHACYMEKPEFFHQQLTSFTSSFR